MNEEEIGKIVGNIIKAKKSTSKTDPGFFDCNKLFEMIQLLRGEDPQVLNKDC